MADATGAAIPLLTRRMRLPLAAGAGVLMALGLAPYGLWPVAMFGLGAALWLAAVVPANRLTGTGLAVGLGYFGFGLNWIVEPFLVDAALTGWMAPFGLIGLAGGLALFWALAFRLAGLFPHRLAALVVTWGAAELARAYVLTGFPWALLAYLWLESPAIQWASVLGPHGLTLATLAASALAVQAVRTRRAVPAAAAAILLAALLGGGVALTPPAQDLSGRPIVRLIQPNVPQHEKWDPLRVRDFFGRQIALTEAPPEGAAPSLIVWPETALPVLLGRADDAIAVMAQAAGPAPLAFGIQRAEAGDYFNSLALIDGQGHLADVYDKHHLVPFGEYMPARWLFRHLRIGGLAARAEGGYTPGPGPRLMDFGPLGRALPLICYEAVFPQDVNGAPARPDWLLQVTNDAWFGEHSGPYQHLAQARIRTIEQGLPLLRAANTGVSAVIDGGGRVLASLPLGQAGHVDAPLPPPARLTLYARTGDLPALVLIFLAGFALVLRARGESR